MRFDQLVFLAGVFCCTLADCHASELGELPAEVLNVLENRCVACHTGEQPEGGVDLHAVNEVSGEERRILLNRIQDQIFYGLMPPRDEDPLEQSERSVLTFGVRSVLQAAGMSELDQRLPYPAYGNYVDHEQLFSPSTDLKASTPARRWLVNPWIFRERMLDVFQLQGEERERFRQMGFYGITSPVLLPEQSGVRDYAIRTPGGGHLLVMLENARWTADKQLASARLALGENNQTVFPNARDRWAPRETPSEFARVLSTGTTAADTLLVSAIQRQFQLVLARAAEPDELERYLALTRSALDAAGPLAAMKQMLTSVLLESEFLYREEFGGGVADEAGRFPLTPREAAWAISYALGDRRPDEKLLQAAATGRLLTAEDYRREAQRLLDDPQYYRGSVDSAINGMRQSMKSRVTSHPRLVRFFREFFGYPMALRVFKDSKRSGGVYVNPDRGSTQTPGHLVNEADRVVTDIVEQDKDVFHRLLTTDRFYLYHPISNEAGSSLVDGWKIVWQELKDTNWKEDPEGVADQYQELLRKHIDSRGVHGKSQKRHDNSLQRLMGYFESTFGQGVKPFTTFPWAHGNHYWHSPIYSLAKTPGRDGRFNELELFDYETVQPFPVHHRKGILTHPAWLVAHSGNFQTDPIRRGRWIREKLLAGSVPEIPITVDARIPDHKDQTLRTRIDGATAAQECMKCHERMNPLGMPFECFDDFGRYRVQESLEHPDNLIKAGDRNTEDQFRTASLDTSGWIDGLTESQLNGSVDDAFELIDRLARAERVRQSIIRHAFRFFMGRNETLSDSSTLIEADQAYLNTGGSFQAVVVSLIGSDSFRLRTATNTNP